MITEEFKKVIRKSTFSNQILLYIIIGVFGFVTFSTITQMTNKGVDILEIMELIGFMLLVFFVIYWFFKSKFIGPKFWIKVFEERPEEILWIKPIVTTHRAVYVIPVAKSFEFEIFLIDGTHTIFHCPTLEMDAFYRGIRAYAAHAHYGFSREIQKLYRKDKVNFLKNASEKGIFTSVNDVTL